jgi:DNA/RNA endonuclease YhcR with UshA esterase domain
MELSKIDLNFGRSEQIILLVLVLAIIGLVGIYFAVGIIDPIETKIGSIGESMVGRLVKISGKISNIRKSKSGNSYWSVDDGNTITVPILDNRFKSLVLKRGDSVEIMGLVTKYKEELEVMPKEIYKR